MNPRPRTLITLPSGRTGSAGGPRGSVDEGWGTGAWIAKNWSGAMRETAGHGRFTSAKDRVVCVRDGVINPNYANHDLSIHQRYGPGGFRFEHKAWPALSDQGPEREAVRL